DGLQAVVDRRATDLYLPLNVAGEGTNLDDLGDDFDEHDISPGMPTDPRLAQAEIVEVERLLGLLDATGGVDSKRERLFSILRDLLDDDRSVLVFTEYYDTLAYLRDSLHVFYPSTLACYSGAGGELWDESRWRSVTKADITRKLAAGRIRILLCNDAASEGLNLQTASAVINYDLPWNPSKIEQRIGRADRIGQKRADVRVINLFLKDSIDDRVYAVLGERCHIFRTFVGPMQPVLASARRMMLGRTPLDTAALVRAATEAGANHLVDAAYHRSAATSVATLPPPLSRDDLRQALGLLTDDTPIRARIVPEDGRYIVSGPGFTETTFAYRSEMLEDDPAAEPLTPHSPRVRELAEALERAGERLPLVIASVRHGAFRACVAVWVGENEVLPVPGWSDLLRLIDKWNGAVPDADLWLDAVQRSEREASASVAAAVECADRLERAGLERQVGAARHRLLRELSRFLLVRHADSGKLNDAWFSLIEGRERDANVRKWLDESYVKLAGWPDWPAEIVDESVASVRDLTDSQRRAGLAGSELQAALNDPRWQAVETLAVLIREA
ncbi:MAG: hypothetical protein M3439_05040, partial [Chloroflexota bacterium]|nr:hypothetical protein [Chloroflexota bacterium]